MTWKKHPELKDHRIDHVGNILQPNKGVTPKACQECEIEFKSERQETEDHDIIIVGIIPRVVHVGKDTIVVCQECEDKT